MRFLIFIVLAFLLLDSCVDPLTIHLKSINANQLVVDGIITNAPGPYEVKLSHPTNFETTLRRAETENNAMVWIVNDLDEKELLKEIAPGVYRSSIDGMQGEIGRSYSLQIKTASGRQYATKPQKMTDAGQIDSLYAEFSQKSVIVSNQPAQDAFTIFLDAHGSAENLFRWRWMGVYKGKTFPELREKVLVGGPVPDPEPCSGYVARGGLIFKVSECICCFCYAYEYSNRALISDNRFVNNSEFKKIAVSTLPITGQRFFERYYFELEQLSISEDTYEFWKLVEAQQKISGSLFQPNSIKVRGNVKSVTDPNEEVLGIFEVSAVTKMAFSLTGSNIPFALPPLDTIAYDCRYSLMNATTDKPLFW